MFISYYDEMSEKAEFLMQEGLFSTAFFGGVWSAIKLNPESVLVHALGQVISELVGPATAGSYIALGELLLALGFFGVVGGVYVIGRKVGLIAFGVMWLAGFLLIQGNEAGVFLLFVGWGLGALAIKIHTNETIGSPSGRGYVGPR